MSEQNPRNSDVRLNEVYFWTATLLNWKHLLKKEVYKQWIMDSLKIWVERKCIVVYGFVLMPNHIHLIWEMKTLNGKEMPDTSFLKFTAHLFKRDLKANHPQVLDWFRADKGDRAYQFPIKLKENCTQPDLITYSKTKQELID